MKKRNDLIDVYRFIASLIIMLYHSYHLDGIKHYPCGGGYIFVEAFFIMTGFFTTKHFREQKTSTIGDSICYSVRYTYKKFSKYLPYTFTIVLLSLIVKHCVIINDINYSMVLKAILESMMLIRGDANVGVLWFLAALLPIFPFFCFGVQKISNGLAIFIAFIIIFLNVMLDNYSVFFPMHYLRALSGLLCGFIVFSITDYIDEHMKKKYTSFLHKIAIVTLLIPVLFSVINYQNNIVCIICFSIGLAFMHVTNSTNQMMIPIAKQLGEVSFLIYLLHLNIADLICYLSQNIYKLSALLQYVMYFVITGFAVLGVRLIVAKEVSIWRMIKSKSVEKSRR